MNREIDRKKLGYFQKKCLSLFLAFCILFWGVFKTNVISVMATGEVNNTEGDNTTKNKDTEESKDTKEKESTEQTSSITLTAPSAVLIEGATGEILYEKDKDKERMIASVTKVMTMLLIMEALDSGKISLEDTVRVSAHAASMGGSQVYLEENETQTVETMLKCISIASANDAAVAMAEHLSGSEEAFVEKMNARALELGMLHTHFLNCCGLDDNITEGHYSSAYDVALMSRELITKHPQIGTYSTTWMDSFIHTTRKGDSEFGLTNTNRLVRTYEGITGLKTGSTSKAKYCLSATASRNGIDMIAVILGAATPKDRFAEAATLLNYGFANTQIYKESIDSYEWEPLPVNRGVKEFVSIGMEQDFTYIFTKGEDTSAVKSQAVFLEDIKAPVKKGDVLGSLEYSYNEKTIGSVNLVALQDIDKMGFLGCLGKIASWYIGLGDKK